MLHLCRKTVVCIQDMNCSRVELVAHVVIMALGVNQNGFPDVIIHRGVTFREFLQ